MNIDQALAQEIVNILEAIEHAPGVNAGRILAVIAKMQMAAMEASNEQKATGPAPKDEAKA